MKKAYLYLILGIAFFLFNSCPSSVPPIENQSSDPIILVSVPAGSFQRDSSSSNISEVSPFQISRFEITRAKYKSIMGIDPSDADRSNGVSDPVQMVTWYDAVEFCNKLSESEGLDQIYSITNRTPETGYPITSAMVSVADWDANGYRLPTEMEWIWAAMGSTSDNSSTWSDGINTSGYQKKYAGSLEGSGITNANHYAWFVSNSDGKTHPVGKKSANELGICDMSGNVDEWCWDLYDDWAACTGLQTDYKGVTSGITNIVRAGNWMGNIDYCALTNRTYIDLAPGSRLNILGFRVVRK